MLVSISVLSQYKSNWLLSITESSEVVATLRGHEASVKSISLHSSGRHALAVSSREAVLWDLDTFARCRTLSGGQEVGVQDVSGPSIILLKQRWNTTPSKPFVHSLMYSRCSFNL